MSSRSLLIVLAAAWAGLAAASQPKPVEAIVTSPAARDGYLGRAVIWRDPGPLSPGELVEGARGVFPFTVAQATAPAGIACAFARPGKVLGGKSPKFTCRAEGGHELRLKFWDADRHIGNRETFATVAATRLLWSLGFVAVPALPMDIRCEGCPEDPARGSGEVRARRYLAVWQVLPPGPKIISYLNTDQGWTWRDLGNAIDAMPAGEERDRQRTHFEALTLLGVFLQHGDRKAEQHALYCEEDIDAGAGEIRSPSVGETGNLLFEHAGASACRRPAVALVDVGATFGGAGRTSNATTAKMNLENWRRKHLFSGRDGCRGDLTISLAAGSGGEANPAITERGRQFLLEQLHRLTPEHVRAIFTSARVDRLPAAGNDAKAGSPDAIGAWVAAFLDKVRQIEARRCSSAP